MTGDTFKELITTLAACTDTYRNIGFHEPLNVQIRVVPSSEWCHVTWMKATGTYSNLDGSSIPCVVAADNLHVDTIDIGGLPPSKHALMSRRICGLLQSTMLPGHMFAQWAVDSFLVDVTPDESTVDMFRQAHWDG